MGKNRKVRELKIVPAILEKNFKAIEKKIKICQGIFKLIQIDGTDLICYDNGDIWRFIIKYKKWRQVNTKVKRYYQIKINNIFK